MKILVVHSQEAVKKAVETAIAKNQVVVKNLSSGLDGLLAARIDHYDLIICGINLPVVTGIEMVRSLRMSSANINTKIVFVVDELNDRVRALASTLGVKDLVLPDEVEKRASAFITRFMTKKENMISDRVRTN